jgi:glycosyltransferase involved in cell wall biosynthesis
MTEDNGEPGAPLHSVSVILPVRNEADTIEESVLSALHQSYAGPLDVIVVDGESEDATADIVTRIVESDGRVHLRENPRGTASAGMNVGIAATDADVIVRCDGHSVLPTGYVELAVTLLNETGADNVGGVQKAIGTTPVQRAIAAAMASTAGVGDARFRRGGPAGPVDTVYLGVFRRHTLVGVGMFDESMVRNQDYELNHRIRAAGGEVYFDPRLVVDYTPRSTLGQLWRQYFDYGRGKRAMLRRHPGSLRWRQAAPPLFVLGLALSLPLLFTQWRLAGLIIPAAYTLFLFVSTLAEYLRRRDNAMLQLPAVLPTMHLGWGSGFLFGRRLRQQ